jgi:hypothetical protein
VVPKRVGKQVNQLRQFFVTGMEEDLGCRCTSRLGVFNKVDPRCWIVRPLTHGRGITPTGKVSCFDCGSETRHRWCYFCADARAGPLHINSDGAVVAACQDCFEIYKQHFHKRKTSRRMTDALPAIVSFLACLYFGFETPFVFLPLFFVFCYFYFAIKEGLLQDWDDSAEGTVHPQGLQRAGRERAQQAETGIFGGHLTDDSRDQPSQPTQAGETLADRVDVFYAVPNGSEDGDAAESGTDGMFDRAFVRKQIVSDRVASEASDSVDGQIRQPQADVVAVEESRRDSSHARGFSSAEKARNEYAQAALHASQLPGSAIPGVADFRDGDQLRVEQHWRKYAHELRPTSLKSRLLVVPVDDHSSSSEDLLGSPD